MTELIDKLLMKGYDWGYIHLFLSQRDICQIFVPYPGCDISDQLKSEKRKNEINIESALVEVDFLRPVNYGKK